MESLAPAAPLDSSELPFASPRMPRLDGGHTAFMEVPNLPLLQECDGFVNEGPLIASNYHRKKGQTSDQLPPGTTPIAFSSPAVRPNQEVDKILREHLKHFPHRGLLFVDELRRACEACEPMNVWEMLVGEGHIVRMDGQDPRPFNFEDEIL